MAEEKKYYTSRTDLVFKTIMMDLPKILEKIIEIVIKEKLEDLEIINPELPITSIEVKSHRLDILVQKENKFLDLEMNNGILTYTRLRNYLYLMDKANNMVETGGSYTKLLDKDFILINLNYGDKYEEKDRKYIIREYKIQDEFGVYLENVRAYDVNLDLLKEMWYDFSSKEKEIYKYLYMLDLEKKELEVFTKGDSHMEEYKDKLNKLNNDKKFIDRISAEEDRLYCYNSDIEIAEEKGKNEGKAEGISIGEKQEKINIAKNMLKEDIDIDLIVKITGLSKEEVLLLK